MTAKERRILEGLAIAACSIVKTIGDDIMGIKEPPDELREAHRTAQIACGKLLRACGYFEHVEPTTEETKREQG